MCLLVFQSVHFWRLENATFREERENLCLLFGGCQLPFTGVDFWLWKYASVVIVTQRDDSLTPLRDAGLHEDFRLVPEDSVTGDHFRSPAGS